MINCSTCKHNYPRNKAKIENIALCMECMSFFIDKKFLLHHEEKESRLPAEWKENILDSFMKVE